MKGYKRLVEPGSIELDEKIICVVGPNGAGKTSFLDALVRLTDGRSIGTKERTRARGSADRLDTTIHARFALDDEDRETLAVIPEAVAAEPTHLEVFKYSDSRGSRARLRPAPTRDLTRRRKLTPHLEQLNQSNWLRSVAEWDDERGTSGVDRTGYLLERALRVAAQESENLSTSQISDLENVRTRLDDVVEERLEIADLETPFPKYGVAIKQAVDSLIEYEKGHPNQDALEALWDKRLPRFLKFEEEDRALRAEYDLSDADAPNAAIKNLLALAGKTWEDVVAVSEDEDKTAAENLEEELNDNLAKAFHRSWDQSDMTLRFRVDANTLGVLLSLQAPGDYFYIDEHSEGVLQFVALRAFIAAQKEAVKPIILIDEVEAHLHYDAQANLISTFEDQEDAEVVIYTTHSAGSLPRDIAVGLRAITPTYLNTPSGPRVTRESEFRNDFWFEEAGFAPVLMAMGASAFAFSTARRAVLVEGLTDALLLPTLLREATGETKLDYQPVPRLSHIDEAQAKDLGRIAASVVFVTDGDGGGKNHKEALEEKGVDASRILALGGEGSDTTLEDLIAPEVFAEAVNGSFQEQGLDIKLDMDAISSRRRMKDLESWCEAQSTPDDPIAPPTKPQLAKAIYAARKRRGGLLDPDHRDTVKTLHGEIENLLG